MVKPRTLACALALPMTALAHDVEAPLPAPWAWSFEPWIVVPLLLTGVLYALGVWRLWRTAGPSRGITRAEASAFAAGWMLLAAAVVSPLDALAAHLFSMHMIQHELLLVLVAPLWIYGRPLAAWAWALPRPATRRIGWLLHRPVWLKAWRALTAAPSAWTLHALALWGWHVPWLFEAALRDPGVHTLQHLSFLASALLFWWALMKPGARDAHGRAVLLLFTTMLHTGVLGALLALSPRPWYSSYLATAPAFGLSPVDDQQLGGLLMWVPGGVAYIAAGLVFAMRWSGLAAPGNAPRGAHEQVVP